MTIRNAILICVLVAAATIAGTALAADSIGWHVVKPGETLQGITTHYLGSSTSWRENWRLNPDVKNPDLLTPGQRIRVILARTLPARFAVIHRVARHVEKKPEPAPWTAAVAGDTLAERHGVHTFESSSAELRFEDQTTLTLTERSLVFLRSSTAVTPKRDRSDVEIVDGAADLEKPAHPARAHDIQITVGSATAAPKGDAASSARFRKEGPGAAVMSYRGATGVTAGGASVNVGEGMGVAVPDGGKPSAPERLLGAPGIAAVDAGVSRPPLAWPAVPGAASYTIEICRDRGCAELVARAPGVESNRWVPAEPLPEGEMFWRVTGRSASGLDGYPAVAAFVVRPGISVSTAADAGEGSLRQAIERANATPGEDIVRLTSSGTIVLASPLPPLTDAIVIEGGAAAPSGDGHSMQQTGSVTQVGMAAASLRNPSRAAVAIDFHGAAIGLDARSNLTLRNLTLSGAAVNVRAAGKLVAENVVVGALLTRSSAANGIEAHGATTLRRLLVTGMGGTGITVAAGAQVDAEDLEVSDCTEGIALASAGSRLRRSYILLNGKGVTVAGADNVIEESSFRGNRDAVAIAATARGNTIRNNRFDDNYAAAIAIDDAARGNRATPNVFSPADRPSLAGSSGAPELRIIHGEDGSTRVGGSALPRSTVELYAAGWSDALAPVVRVIVNEQGTFEAIVPGDVFAALAIDADGNTSAMSVPVKARP
jgi:hypothetical protein